MTTAHRYDLFDSPGFLGHEKTKHDRTPVRFSIATIRPRVRCKKKTLVFN